MEIQFEIEPISRFDRVYDSNRIFRSLVKALSIVEGIDRATEFINIALEDREAKISSIIPLINNEVYLPAIRGFIEEPEDEKDDDKKRKIQKKLKKAAYYKMKDFQELHKNPKIKTIEDIKEYSYLDENMNLDYFDEEKRGDIKNLVLLSEHNKVPLFNIGDTEIFYEKDIVFDRRVKFLILARGKEEFLSRLEKSFEYLQNFGLSHSYCVGRGQVRIRKREENIEIKSGLEGYLVSSLYPTIEEARKIEWENSYLNYEIYQAFRWDNKYSYAIPIIKAGSLIKGELPKGQIIYAGNAEKPEKRGVYFGRGFYL
ncbi:MAG: hypothetical protein QXV44_03575 [Candidatus Anstonellaceae archaeon]